MATFSYFMVVEFKLILISMSFPLLFVLSFSYNGWFKCGFVVVVFFNYSHFSWISMEILKMQIYSKASQILSYYGIQTWYLQACIHSHTHTQYRKLCNLSFHDANNLKLERMIFKDALPMWKNHSVIDWLTDWIHCDSVEIFIWRQIPWIN